MTINIQRELTPEYRDIYVETFNETMFRIVIDNQNDIPENPEIRIYRDNSDEPWKRIQLK